MRISRVKLNNYVCFYDEDAEWVELGPGINFVVGKNNCGKTAFLKLLSHIGKGEPHRSDSTVPKGLPTLVSSETSYEVEYLFSNSELTQMLLDESKTFYLPTVRSKYGNGSDRYGGIPEGYLTRQTPSLAFKYSSNQPRRVTIEGQSEDFDVASDTKLECFKLEGNRFADGRVYIKPFQDRYMGLVNLTVHNMEAAKTCWAKVAQQLPSFVYRFDAERRIPAVARVESGRRLRSDASNLPSVLSTLRGTPRRLFNEYLDRLFPEIREIQFEPGDGVVELLIDYHGSQPGRDDLAVSLAECGTGLAQVLAMLYVVVTESDPRVIIIDEPNSFLHPSAVREVLAIFQENDHHQYILATHSPTAIASVTDKTILLVERDRHEEHINTNRSKQAI